MKIKMLLAAALIATAALSAQAGVHFGFSFGLPLPGVAVPVAPVVPVSPVIVAPPAVYAPPVVMPPSPGVGYVWAPGYWSIGLYGGRTWVPGYWHYGPSGHGYWHGYRR